ncbi:MAG: NYN domain-containing protein [Bifidobacteriaceae bacterium]|jgi:hypothetical protein|nr:NYN domain-containing protein [Bifidobacteriaceae bacterium]
MFIDGQNMVLSTENAPEKWQIDLFRLRVYLRRKYEVVEAYCFVGAYRNDNEDLYSVLKRSGYTIIFREHGVKLKSKNKGNVDCDVVFEMMRNLRDRSDLFDKILLISADGDYFRTVRYLIENERFLKILLPSHHNASSLYLKLPPEYFDYLDWRNVKKKIMRVLLR